MATMRALLGVALLAPVAAFRAPLRLSATDASAAAAAAPAAAVAGGRVAGIRIGVAELAPAEAALEALGLAKQGAGFGFGAAEGHAAVVLEAEALDAGDGFLGLVLHASDAPARADALEAAGGRVVTPLEDLELGASMVPDEEVDTKTLKTVGWFEGPGGLGPLELVQKRRRDGLFGAVLRVDDLEEAVAFYEKALGMTLLRKRSNLPLDASISAYMGYGAGDEGAEGGFVVELKYEYGEVPIKPGNKCRGLLITTEDVEAAAECVRQCIAEGDYKLAAVEQADGTCVVTDVNGYKVELLDAVDYMMATM